MTGRYQATPTTLKDGDQSPPLMDSNGRLVMSATAGAGANQPQGGGGRSGIYATNSFTPAAAAYSANDIISTAKEFAFTFANGDAIPSGSLIRILSTVVKIDATAVISGETSYTLQTYSVTPPSAQADNDAWTLASADLPSYRGSIALGTPVDLGAALYVKTGLIDTDIKLAGTSLFAELQTVGAFTATAVARQIELRGIVL
jgi:hypothetical protein